MSLVLLHHIWHKFLAHPEMRDDVDLEDCFCPFVCGFEDGVGTAYAGIVDEDGWVAPCQTKGVGGVGDGGGGCYVAVEVFDVTVWVAFQLASFGCTWETKGKTHNSQSLLVEVERRVRRL